MVEGVGLGRDHHFILPKQSKPTTVLHTRHNQHWGKLEICFNGLHLTNFQFCFHKKQNCGSFFSYQIGKYLNCSVVPKPSAVPVHDDHGVRRGWEAAAAVGIVGLVSSAKTLCRLFFSFSVLEPYLCLWSHSTLLVPTRVNELVVLSFFFSLHWVTWPSLVSCLSMLYNIGTVKKVICWYIWTHKVWVWAVMGLAGLFRCRVGFHGVWFQGVRFWWRLLRDLWRKSVYVSPLFPWLVGPLATSEPSALVCALEGCPQYSVDHLVLFRNLCEAIHHMACSSWFLRTNEGISLHRDPLYRTRSTFQRASRTCMPPWCGRLPDLPPNHLFVSVSQKVSPLESTESEPGPTRVLCNLLPPHTRYLDRYLAPLPRWWGQRANHIPGPTSADSWTGLTWLSNPSPISATPTYCSRSSTDHCPTPIVVGFPMRTWTEIDLPPRLWFLGCYPFSTQTIGGFF